MIRHNRARHFRTPAPFRPRFAKLSGPLFSTNAVGSIGGALTYNNWRGIQYVKALTPPSQPRTPRQLEIRAFMNILSGAWQGLTDAQRLGWNVWADAHQPNDDQFNRPTPWSGFNAFVGLNMLVEDMVGTYAQTAPVVVGPDPPAVFTVTQDVDDVDVTWTATGGTNFVCDIWKVTFASVARNPNIQLFKHLTYAVGETGTYTDTAPGGGTHHYLGRIVDEDNGQSSTYQRDRVTMT